MSIDFSPLVNALPVTAVITSVMSVAAMLAAIYVVVFACSNLISIVRGHEPLDWRMKDHLGWWEMQSMESDFRRRQQREDRTRKYRAWKRAKGL